jgi:hypothetical protein
MRAGLRRAEKIFTLEVPQQTIQSASHPPASFVRGWLLARQQGLV